MASQVCDKGMVYHVASSTYGYMYWVIGMEGIIIGGLAGLYKESCRFRTMIKVPNHVV